MGGYWVNKWPGWRPAPPYDWGDYYLGSQLGYDHSFTPFGTKREFRELETVNKWCSAQAVDSIKRLPMNKLILPELLIHTRWFPLEPMLAVLMEGKWGRQASWKVYARLLLVRRIDAGRDRLFQDFGDIVPDVIDFVLYGGSRKQRNKILADIRLITMQSMQIAHVHATARFLGSCLAEDPTLCLIRPFHWLRCAYIPTDPVITLGLGEFQKEMRASKLDLFNLMQTKMSRKLIEDLS